LKKQILLLIMSTFLLTGTILPVLADGPLVNARYYGTGKYSTVAAGVGMVDYTSATINIDVPGTQVIAAFLYWAGFDVSPGGDNTIEFQGDTLVADEQFGPEFWK
jgi:hypothetical protein